MHRVKIYSSKARQICIVVLINENWGQTCAILDKSFIEDVFCINVNLEENIQNESIIIDLPAVR